MKKELIAVVSGNGKLLIAKETYDKNKDKYELYNPEVKETKEEKKEDLELEAAKKEADELGVEYRSDISLKTLLKKIKETKENKEEE